LAENPLLTLTRVLGGVILTQGRLGHQVLGQMLIMGSHEVAVAGASVVVAASSRQKNAVGQVALRTAAPALAVRLLLNKQEKRLALERQRLNDERRKADRLHAERVRAFEAMAHPADAPSPGPTAGPAGVEVLPVDTRLDEASAEIAALRQDREDLQRKLARLAARQPPKAPPAKPRKRKRTKKPRKR
jgi:hypothetical protein